MLNLITEHINIWTAAQTQKNNGSRGRGKNSNGQSLYGIQKLRELILELAVRGKLVPQIPDDEPTSVLLDKITKEKKRLIKKGKIKKQKPFPIISGDEKPFDLPQGWEWAWLGEIAQHNSGKTLDKGRNEGKSREYITTSNLYWGYFILDNLRKMPIKDSELEKCTAKKNDLLICEGGEAGRASVWEFEESICLQNHIHRVRFFCKINPYYAYRFFEKLNYTGEINKYRKGVAISNMSGKTLSSIIIPLPPIAEQHRIVAKLDELMVLCDQLEQHQTDSSDTHLVLVETLLATLTNAADQRELAEAWQRIANHFDTLFTTEQSIDQFKQTILQLAVMGKLVLQDPQDEPASVLLKKIAKEKARLIKEGKIKKIKTLPEIKKNGETFKLPEGWMWSRLIDVCSLVTQGPNPKYYNKTNPKYGVLKTKDFYDDIIHYDKITPISYDTFKEFKRYKLLNNDIIFGLVGKGSTAKCNIFMEQRNVEHIFTRATGLIRLLNPTLILPVIIKQYFTSLLGKNTSDSITDGSTGQLVIKTSELKNVVIPVPPLKEQHRIVAKVNELITLCDNLKARLNDVQTTQAQLADALVEQAVA
ncbi:MAG: restriction endonuclease subunit S [Thermodesulfobacteriota bacterium]|nr:restriction endonuclease subunit S [Thermodesulfobacteriota bacterium]